MPKQRRLGNYVWILLCILPAHEIQTFSSSVFSVLRSALYIGRWQKHCFGTCTSFTSEMQMFYKSFWLFTTINTFCWLPRSWSLIAGIFLVFQIFNISSWHPCLPMFPFSLALCLCCSFFCFPASIPFFYPELSLHHLASCNWALHYPKASLLSQTVPQKITAEGYIASGFNK